MRCEPTLGLALIAKDEEETLPRLLASVEGAFDQVVLLDTGSSDRTVEVFEAWSDAEERRQPGFVPTLGRFDWCDDFAAARNAADDLLHTDWLAWADCDDEIIGAKRLRSGLRHFPSLVKALAFPYDLANIENSRPRTRLHRRGAGLRWRSRLHEHLNIETIGLDAVRRILRAPGEGGIRWLHGREVLRSSSMERDLRILRRWASEEPQNPTPLGMLAATGFFIEDFEVACEALEAYIHVRRFVRPGHREAAEAALVSLTDSEMGWGAAISAILGRDQNEWLSASAAEADLREPAQQVPKSRQVRRAEARAAAKRTRRREAMLP